MNMMNTGDILETIEMFTQDNLDVRTVTMGISLLDCIDPDPTLPSSTKASRRATCASSSPFPVPSPRRTSSAAR